MSSSAVASKIRRTRRLMLIAGLSVIERDACTIQVGVDAPLRVLIGDAPPGTAQLLNALNGERTIGDLTRCYGDRHGVPYASWDRLLTELVDQGFVVERSPIGTQGQHEWTGQAPDRTALTMEFEGSRAEPGMSRRRDAVVVIVGAGRVAGSLATLLAAAGVGHVHLDPHRAVRASDAAPAGLTMDQVLELAAVPEAVDRSTIAVRAAQTADNSRQSSRVRRVRGAHVTRDPRPAEPRRVDRDELAALIRRVSPAANVHAPGGYVPPSIVVLATDGPPDHVRARGLVADRVPHLAVRASELRGVVGPLVLPGRSSCLHCHDLHRRDLDPSWPKVLLAMGGATPVPPAVLATSVAAVGAGQVLDFLDARRTPDSVDGTLESTSGEWVIRRRSWQPHPDCFCQRA